MTYTDCGGERLLRQDYKPDKPDDTEAECGADQVDGEGLTIARRAQSAVAVEVSGQAVGALVAGAGRNHRSVPYRRALPIPNASALRAGVKKIACDLARV